MGKIILWLYALSTQIATIVFWIQMVKEDAWWQIIFIDPFIAELEGLVWPFFL